MSTSGTYTFTVNRDQIITDAMLDCGALGVGEAIVDADLQFCARRLNMMVKQWCGTMDFAPGLKMWKRLNGNLFLSATTGTYTLGPGGVGWASSFSQISLTATATAGANSLTVSSITGIGNGDNIGIVLDSLAIYWTTVNGAPSGSTINLNGTLPSQASNGNVVYSYPVANEANMPVKVLTAVLRDQFNNDIPLYLMTLQEYQGLPTKTQVTSPTDPTSIYYQRGLTTGMLKTDAPAAADCNKRIHMVYLDATQDFDLSTDNPDFPPEWYLPLVTNLSILIAPGFQLPVTADMKEAATRSLAIAQQQDAETSAIFFQKGQDDFAPWGNYT